MSTPEDAVSVSTDLLFTPLNEASLNLPGTFAFGGIAFQIEAYQNGVHVPDFVFNHPITIELDYGQVDLPAGEESDLTLLYHDPQTGRWQNDGITLVNLDTANRQASFPVGHLSIFGLFLQPTSLSLSNVVSSTEGVSYVPLGTQVTYTMDLFNNSAGTATNVTLTDPLPDGVTFNEWIQQSSATASGNTVTWGPADIPAGGHAVISFTALASLDAEMAAAPIVNTATFNASNLDPGLGRSSFTLNAPPETSLLEVSASPDTPVVISPFTNVSNPDGSPLTLGAVSTPSHGDRLTLDNKITYTPATDFLGTDTLTYFVLDGKFSVEGTIRIRVAVAVPPGDESTVEQIPTLNFYGVLLLVIVLLGVPVVLLRGPFA